MDPVSRDQSGQRESEGLEKPRESDLPVRGAKPRQQDRQYRGRVEECQTGEERARVDQKNAEVPAKMTGGEGRRPRFDFLRFEECAVYALLPFAALISFKSGTMRGYTMKTLST